MLIAIVWRIDKNETRKGIEQTLKINEGLQDFHNPQAEFSAAAKA